MAPSRSPSTSRKRRSSSGGGGGDAAAGRPSPKKGRGRGGAGGGAAAATPAAAPIRATATVSPPPTRSAIRSSSRSPGASPPPSSPPGATEKAEDRPRRATDWPRPDAAALPDSPARGSASPALPPPAAADGSSCAYSASAAGRGHDGRLTKAYVCVYDRRAKTLQLIPTAERGMVFALEQAAREYVPAVGADGGGASTAAANAASIDPSAKGSEYRIKVAFFLFALVKFKRRVSPRGAIPGETADDCVAKMHVPHEAGVRMLELFATPAEGGGAADGGEEGVGGYICTRQQRSKLACHMLVLYAIASGREMKVPSLNQFCADAKLNLKEATLVMREAGFAVRKVGAGDASASLSVPLKFPPPRRGKRT
ncbi:hypothetical protein ACHAWF_015305 [Thalassiosira exigua]